LPGGRDPTDEVNLTWQRYQQLRCYQQLRSTYHVVPAKGRQIAQRVLDSFHTCPIPEVARLGRTLRAWRTQLLAYFDTSGGFQWWQPKPSTRSSKRSAD
jgi:transposase